MLNYWWVTRPKRKLDSVPEVLAAFADVSLNQQWSGQRETQISYEDVLEKAGLKREGSRRDHSGSGGRTYGAWLQSLGLIFRQESTGNIRLTLAGEALMNGQPPVDVLKNQVLKYQFPSSFSLSRGVQVSSRFHIRPFRFLLRLLSDSRVEYLAQSEIARIVITEAENENDACFERIVRHILQYRAEGDACLPSDFFERYKPGRGAVNPDFPFRHLEDIANTLINWMEYTQLAVRDDEKHLRILPSAKEEVRGILSFHPPLIDRPECHEYFQRKYGLDPKHRKDTRNLEKTETVTTRMIAEQKVKQAYVSLSLKRPVTGITQEIVSKIAEETGLVSSLVEETLLRLYPHGSVGSFLSSYFEMAFSGREEATDFEKATAELFQNVFGYRAVHLGQTGSLSAPDILLLSDSEGYQSVIDNKAYAKYSITGDHHNRMVCNYLGKIRSYSDSSYPVGFFAYIAGGFGNAIDGQIRKEVRESGIHGSGITVSRFIEMIRKQNEGRGYSHEELRKIFSVDRQILSSDY